MSGCCETVAYQWNPRKLLRCALAGLWGRPVKYDGGKCEMRVRYFVSVPLGNKCWRVSTLTRCYDHWSYRFDRGEGT